MQEYCLKCMRKLGDSPVCARCGFDNTPPVKSEPYHLKPGSVLAGKYLIGKVIGEGGFGITYIGLQMTLSKRVAIKEYYPSGAANRSIDSSENVIVTGNRIDFYEKGMQRFLDEAKNVAAFCEEDGIVDIMDYFRENNTAYIVMEYLEGETLKDYVSHHGVFMPERLISLMIPLMQSLNSMHTQGIIHRDISPDNIMYHKLQRLKLMDFGSARFYTNEERQLSVVLKQGFAPEEQYRGNGVQGPYTDVYALCATIYTCITGRVPVNSVERLVDDTLKRPSELGVKIAPYQENAIMHGLAVKASERTPNITVLIRELTTDNVSSRHNAANVQSPLPVSEPPKVKTILQQPVADSPRPTARPAAYNGNAGNGSYAPNLNAQNSYRQSTNAQSSYSQGAYNQNSYTPNSYTPNSYDTSSYPQQPAPKKNSNLPKILAIVIIAVTVIAAGIIIAVVLTGNSGGKSDGGSDSSTVETSATSAPIETTTPTVPETTVRPTEPTTAPAGNGLTVAQAQLYGNDIKDYFFDNIFKYDDKVSENDQIKSLGVYYVEKKGGGFTLIYYLYQNITAGYYRTVSISPNSLAVSNGKLVEKSNSFDADEAGTTLDEAAVNSYFLSDMAENYYNYTQLYPTN